ncbi:MAG: DUF5329 domain-containing protein [Nitrospiraceae bacterium]
MVRWLRICTTAVLACLISLGSVAGAIELSERQKIEALLASLKDISGAVFIRNGRNYDADKAIDHLKRKLTAAGSRVKTAEEFIACCASGSSISGEPYRIKFPDGRIVNSADYFRAKLNELNHLNR